MPKVINTITSLAAISTSNDNGTAHSHRLEDVGRYPAVIYTFLNPRYTWQHC